MNVIDRAESLCGDTYRYEENAEDADGTLRNLVDRANILPDLVAECKRQQEEIETLEKMATGLSNDLDDFGEQNEALRERVEKAERDCVSLEASSRSITDAIGCEWSQDAAIRAVSELQAEAARWQAVTIRERANVLIQTGDCTQHPDAALIHHRCECKYDVDACPVRDWWMEKAAAALGQPRAWAMSKERIAALEEALNAMEWVDNHDSGFGLEDERAVLQGMLSEAKQ